jgi:predicted nucleotidyltransferase
MNKTEVINILFEFKKKNTTKYGIKNLGIFGSYAKDNADPYSDIDVVIETSKADLFMLVHLKDELEKLFNRKVDIIRYRERMNQFLKKHIDEEAIYV